jgi:hypothetical protein
MLSKCKIKNVNLKNEIHKEGKLLSLQQAMAVVDSALNTT